MKINEETIIKNSDNSIKKNLYMHAFIDNDVYTACSFFNELEFSGDPELFLNQACLYSQFLCLKSCEVDCILKMLTYENFIDFNPQYVFNSLMFYANNIAHIDCSKYYAEFLAKRFKGKLKINVINDKKNILQKTKLKIVQENAIEEVKESRNSFMSPDMEESQKQPENIDKKTSHNLKIRLLDCYILLAEEKIEEAEKEAFSIIKENPKCNEVIPILYEISSKNNDRKEEIQNIVLNFNNTMKDIVVDMIKSNIYCDRKQFKTALDFIESNNMKSDKSISIYYMQVKARCLFNLGKKDEAIEVLKTELCINPKDFYTRFILKRLSLNQDVDDTMMERVYIGKSAQIVYKEIQKCIKMSDERFSQLDQNECTYYLYWLNIMNFYNESFEFVKKIVNTKVNLEFLLNFLIKTEINSVLKIVILINVISVGYTKKIYCLDKNMKMRSGVVDYPAKLFSDSNLVQSSDYLAKLTKDFQLAFAISYQKLLLESINTVEFSKNVDKLFDKVCLLENKEVDELCKVDIMTFLILNNCANISKALSEVKLNKTNMVKYKKLSSLLQEI